MVRCWNILSGKYSNGFMPGTKVANNTVAMHSENCHYYDYGLYIYTANASSSEMEAPYINKQKTLSNR